MDPALGPGAAVAAGLGAQVVAEVARCLRWRWRVGGDAAQRAHVETLTGSLPLGGVLEERLADGSWLYLSKQANRECTEGGCRVE